MQNQILLFSSLLLTGTNLVLTQCGTGFNFIVKQARETDQQPVLDLEQADTLPNLDLIQNISSWALSGTPYLLGSISTSFLSVFLVGAANLEILSDLLGANRAF